MPRPKLSDRLIARGRFGEIYWAPTGDTRAHEQLVARSLHMTDEASYLSPSSAPSVDHSGDTRYSAAPSFAADSSYELHVLPEKARHTGIATSETRPDDEHRVFRASRPNSQHREEMSRAPLLVRSSPAQGTGKLMARGILANMVL